MGQDRVRGWVNSVRIWYWFEPASWEPMEAVTWIYHQAFYLDFIDDEITKKYRIGSPATILMNSSLKKACVGKSQTLKKR